MDDDLLAGNGRTPPLAPSPRFLLGRASLRDEQGVGCGHKKAFNQRPGFMAVGGYDGIHLIYEALKKTGGKTGR